MTRQIWMKMAFMKSILLQECNWRNSTHTNMIGMARLTDGSFSWDFGVDDQMNQKSNVMMLTQNENGELIWSEAQHKKQVMQSSWSTDKGPGAFSLTPTDEKNERSITC